MRWDMEDIGAKLFQCWERRQCAVIATIVAVKGSAYRREGARCLITEAGELTGFISGGCVEADLQVHAREVFHSGSPRKLVYDFRWDSPEIWGMGVGCNGSIEVWLELFDPLHSEQYARSIVNEFQRRKRCTAPYLASIVVESANEIAVPVGQRGILPESGSDDCLDKEAGLISTCIRDVEVTLFIEKILPRPRLSIIGAGPDAALLCQAAQVLKWRVTVIDHRASYANARFFPQAEEIQVIPRGDFSKLAASPADYFVVMTHSLDLDTAALQHLLPRDIAYIGLLGSRQRSRMMLQQIRLANPTLPKESFEKLYAPVGLDLGAKSPNEIMLSIMAELVAHRNGKSGRSLRQSQEFSNV